MFMPNIFSFIKSYSEFVELSENDKGYQRTMEWSKIKLVVTITFNGWHPWTIVLESAILDVSAILDPSPHLHSLRKKFFKIMESNFSIALCDWTFSKNFFFFSFWVFFHKHSQFTGHQREETIFNSSPPASLASKALTHYPDNFFYGSWSGR